MDNVVDIYVNDTLIEKWDNLNISKSIDTLCGSISFTTPIESDTIWIGPGLTITVRYNGTLFFTGYLEKRTRSSSTRAFQYTHEGREKTCDLVDCSAVHKKGQWLKDTHVADIAGALCSPYNILVGYAPEADVKMKRFTLSDGETVCDALNRMCRVRNIHPITTGQGNLRFVRVGTEKEGDQLVMGINISDIEEKVDFTSRYSDYECKLQLSSETSIDYLEPGQKEKTWVSTVRGVATDDCMKNYFKRYRKIVIHPEYQDSNSGAKKVADWESRVRAARSAYLSVSATSWGYGKKVWQYGNTVDLVYEGSGLSGSYLISTTNFLYSTNAGIKCSIVLVDKNAYLPEPLPAIKRSVSVKEQVNYLKPGQPLEKVYDSTKGKSVGIAQ